jgi:hypothetical protein
MGEVLGVGMTHYPGLRYPDAQMANILRQLLERADAAHAWRDAGNWPPAMRAEWSDDEGLAAATVHRERQVEALRRIREEIDRFAPDFVLIWGDDQAENFKEDVVPAFCVLLYDSVVCRPFARGSAITRGKSLVHAVANVWNEPVDQAFTVQCHREGGRALAAGLLDAGFDVAYAFKPLHHEELTHAFINTLLYLDYDRRGFAVPVVPFHVNCYGRDLFRGRARFGGRAAAESPELADRPAPPGPSPRRCFDLGRAVREVIEASPWRVALIGSSSWSHAFLRGDGVWLHPDVETDHRRYEELRDGQHARWRDLSSDEIERAGAHEFRNWICLAGAMWDRKAEIVDYVETHVFNSNKCFAIFR